MIKSKNKMNSYISTTFKKDPVLAAVISSALDHGRVYLYIKKISKSFKKNFGIAIEVLDEPILPILRLLRPQDIYFIETDDVSILHQISSVTCAQIILISDSQKIPKVFFDYQIELTEYKSLRAHIKNNISKLRKHHDLIEFNNPNKKPAVFLDRDGVVIKHVDYISKAEDVELVPGIVDLIKKFRKNGYKVIIVTNQSGIGRQHFSWDDYDSVTEKMLQLLADKNTFVDKVILSPFFEKSKLAIGLIRKSLRKPRSGMILSVCNELNLCLNKSILVGDRASDIVAAMLAGLKAAYLLKSDIYPSELTMCNDFETSADIKFKTKIKLINSIKDIS